MAPKAKTAAKKTVKTPLKVSTKTKSSPVKKSVKKVDSKKVELKKPTSALVVAKKSAAPKPATHVKPTPVKHESVFDRLLREKRERHEHHMKQNAQGHHSGEQRMPHNHASYSKFAGPRRRAS